MSLEYLPSPSQQATPQEIPRGVKPPILLSQVRSTAPYLDELDWSVAGRRYLQLLQNFKDDKELDHASYFELCVAAHFATCGSFVPTDVDNQIRFKLWHPALSEEVLIKMVELVFEVRTWDSRPVTTRFMEISPLRQLLSGHRGEWLTIAAGAYGALRRKMPHLSFDILDLIREEIDFEIKAYKHLRESQEGTGLLKCSAFLAHNIGDLLRVIEMWGLKSGDPLFDFSELIFSKEYFEGILLESSALYKHMMAPECHRFFAMREAKCLRQSSDLLIPMGPFFDDWGKTIALHSSLTASDIAHVAQCLIDGWARLTNSVGYARALCGIETHFSGGAAALQSHLPSRLAKAWKTGELRQLCAISKERFEGKWSTRALKFVREFRG